MKPVGSPEVSSPRLNTVESTTNVTPANITSAKMIIRMFTNSWWNNECNIKVVNTFVRDITANVDDFMYLVP